MLNIQNKHIKLYNASINLLYFYNNDASFCDFRKEKIIYNNRRTVDITAINRVS